MSAPANPNTNSKAPVEQSDHLATHHRGGAVQVQPARVSDLQPKYAQQLDYDSDQSAEHTWYASLSKCFGNYS